MTSSNFENLNFRMYYPCWNLAPVKKSIKLCKFQIQTILWGTDHDVRNDDVIVGNTVEQNLKNCFFLKAIENLRKLSKFELYLMCKYM